jgi:hypothetical protein
MRWGIGRPTPALLVALLALVAALSGTVYAAGRIDGRTVKVKSLPGNRIKIRSVPGNRIKPGTITADLLRAGVLDAGPSGTITGSQIDERSLGQVPSASYADYAATAQSAVDAQTALNSVNAVNAEKVNGHGAGCLPGTTPFAGACWHTSPSTAAATAPVAAAACAAQGGSLPEALELAAFAQEPGIELHSGSEWSNDVVNVTGLDLYAVVIVSPAGKINFAASDNSLRYRCVIPLVT